jgi:ABC-type glutathione transport system ATPase component
MAKKLLEVDGVTLRYAGEHGMVTATENVSFSVDEGEQKAKFNCVGARCGNRALTA